MTVDRLKRVMWRLRTMCPDDRRPTYTDLRRAIMNECGTDPRTFKFNLTALKQLGWIRTYSGKRFELTNDDLTE